MAGGGLWAEDEGEDDEGGPFGAEHDAIGGVIFRAEEEGDFFRAVEGVGKEDEDEAEGGDGEGKDFFVGVELVVEAGEEGGERDGAAPHDAFDVGGGGGLSGCG